MAKAVRRAQAPYRKLTPQSTGALTVAFSPTTALLLERAGVRFVREQLHADGVLFVPVTEEEALGSGVANPPPWSRDSYGSGSG